MAIQSIEQRRAKYALEKVAAMTDDQSNNKSEWLSRANEMPAMIQMNGLGQTVAFYLSKGGVHQKMYDLLSEWLCQKIQILPADQNFIHGITHCDIKTYRAAQAEAQALLIWVKKFSKAHCKDTE